MYAIGCLLFVLALVQVWIALLVFRQEERAEEILDNMAHARLEREELSNSLTTAICDLGEAVAKIAAWFPTKEDDHGDTVPMKFKAYHPTDVDDVQALIARVADRDRSRIDEARSMFPHEVR